LRREEEEARRAEEEARLAEEQRQIELELQAEAAALEELRMFYDVVVNCLLAHRLRCCFLGLAEEELRRAEEEEAQLLAEAEELERQLAEEEGLNNYACAFLSFNFVLCVCRAITNCRSRRGETGQGRGRRAQVNG
jgi:hypothetical protein